MTKTRTLARIAACCTPMIVAVAVVVTLATPALVAAQANDPDFEAIVPEPVLEPGTTSGLTVQLVNEASDPDEDVGPARNVRATLRANGTPLAVRSGTRALGDFPADDAREVTYQVTVPDTIESGTYDLAVEVRYDHGDERTTENLTATVRIDDRPRFEVVDSDSNVSIGDTGAIALDIENVGSEDARGASVTLESTSGAVAFGGASTTTRFAGDWEVGETKTVVFDASVAETAETRQYPLQATVSYESPDGVPGASRTLSVGVTPGPEQTFDVDNVTSTLRVGEEGELRGELVNTADTPVRNAVVVFAPESRTIDPVETEVAVGDLDAGERAPFSFDVDVSESAGAGERQFSVDVRYRDRNGDRRASDPIDLRVAVEPERERFAVDSSNASVEAGSDGTVRLHVTNHGDEPVSDVSAKLFASSPISATDDEAFVLRLEPGETAELVFGVSAATGANAKVYPLSVDFQYDTPDGDTELSETYRVPLTVQEPETSTFPTTIVLGVVGVLVVLAVGTFLYRRA